jgi:tRNA 2-thiouridine synthesizing protein A
MTQHDVDARRLLCPLPVIRLQQAVKQAQAGDQIALYCTDPGARSDVPAWCRVHGHTVLEIAEADDELIISVRVKD